MSETLADLAEHLAAILADVAEGAGSIACVSIDKAGQVQIAAAGEGCADAMACLLASAQALEIPDGATIN